MRLGIACVIFAVGCGTNGGGHDDGGGADASNVETSTHDAPNDADADASTLLTPGWSLVAVDTPLRTYVDYVDVPSSGTWTPEANGWPILAQWEQQTTYSALRFQPFEPGAKLTPAQITKLLPRVALVGTPIDVTAPPYSAAPSPADAASAIQSALDAAGKIATVATPVDVIVPAGTYRFGKVLDVPANVRLRGSETAPSILQATDPANSAIHLSGDHGGLFFLVIQSPSSTTRLTTPWAGGIWVGPATSGTYIHDTWVIGNEIATPAAAHVFAIGEEGGLWAFNDAHDGYADNFHHTGRSYHCQVVANLSQTSATRGDDFYPFVGYAGDGDPVHHCTCIANWGRDGHARGLAAVGAGFISFQNNDIARTQAAGIYVAQEDGYVTYGTFDLRIVGNTIDQANLGSSHDGLLAYSDSPTKSDPSITFASVPHQIQRISVDGNTITNTAPGIGNGYGIEIRSSADTGDLTGNTLAHNRAPGIVVGGTNYTQSNNTITP